MQENKQTIIKYILITFLSLIFIINTINASSLDKLPVIGSMVNIDKLKISFASGNNELDASIPNIEYQNNVDERLNKEINKLTFRIIDSFFKEFDDDNHHYTKIDYEVITDNYEWFTLKINVLETMASSSNFAKYYHINKKTNQLTKLSDLFKNGDYKEVLVQEIKKQMLERMSEDPTITYWIDDYDDGTFKTIEDDQNFYFNKKGELVIFFNEYEVGPGSIGSQEFVIPTSIYEDYLK